MAKASRNFKKTEETFEDMFLNPHKEEETVVVHTDYIALWKAEKAAKAAEAEAKARKKAVKAAEEAGVRGLAAAEKAIAEGSHGIFRR